MKKTGGLFIECQKALFSLTVSVVALLFGKFHPRHFGQMADGLRIGQIFQLHDKGNDAAPLAAAKAVVHLPVGHHMEGGGFFSMKGAQPPIAAALLVEGDIIGDHIDNVAPGHQFINKPRWNCHAHAPFRR